MKIGQPLCSLILCSLIFFSSCTFKIPYAPVLLGNYAFGRGDYQEAAVYYLKSLDRGEFSQWIQYNLANVYHSLGEHNAALELWHRALETDSTALLFAIHYNMGTLFYEQGRYEEAFESFKTSLSYTPTHIGAKLNLELTLLKLQPSRSSLTQRQQRTEQELSTDSIRIFEYIRRKEAQTWIQQNQDQQFPPTIDNW